MGKFKKIKIKPLTDFDSLKLQVASKKRYDATVLSPDEAKEMMTKLLMIIKSSPGAIVAKPIAGTQYVSAVVRTTQQKKKMFSFPEPNPIHIYYHTANMHLGQAEINRQQFLQIGEGHPYEGYEAFCQFFQEMVQGVIFLLMTIEGFINQLPAEGTTYTIDGAASTKKDIEWMNFTDKTRKAIPILTGTDFYATNRPDYDRLQLLNDLRDDLIHLKTLEQANFTYYEQLFKRLLDFPSLEISDAVYGFINTIKGDFWLNETLEKI